MIARLDAPELQVSPSRDTARFFTRHAKPARRQAEAMLRELAFVLAMTEKVKTSLRKPSESASASEELMEESGTLEACAAVG